MSWSLAKEDILLELIQIDASQDKIEYIAELFVSNITNVEDITHLWMDQLQGAVPSERLPFLYVANHVFHLDKSNKFKLSFQEVMEEAVSLVCNHPDHRQNVLYLLGVWEDRGVFEKDLINRMIATTGESNSTQLTNNTSSDKNDLIEMEKDHAVPVLPSNFSTKTGCHLTSILESIDKVQCILLHLKSKGTAMNLNGIIEASYSYTNTLEIHNNKSLKSPEGLLEDMKSAIAISKLKKKYTLELSELIIQLKNGLKEEIDVEKTKQIAIEKKLQACDDMDIALAELEDHKSRFPEKWQQEKQVFNERKTNKEEMLSRRASEIHRKSLEAIANVVSPHVARTPTEKDEETDNTKKRKLSPEKKKDRGQLIWHPVLKELVRVPSSNLNAEEWRDH